MCASPECPPDVVDMVIDECIPGMFMIVIGPGYLVRHSLA